MSDKQKYTELKENVIGPIMEKLKAEYEDQGYECYISTIKPDDITKGTRQGTKVIRSTYGAISLSRKNIVNDIVVTVSVFLSDSSAVVVKRMGVLGGRSFKLDEITAELIEKEVRENFK